MKKNDWLLFTAVILYSYLFYQQGLGINFLLFTLFLLIALVSTNQTLIKNTNWLLAATGSLLSAGCVAYYGNFLSFTANFISLSLVSGLSCTPRSSVLFTLLSSWYSVVLAAVFMVQDYLKNKQLQVRQSGNPVVTRTWLIGLPAVIVILFFFMYRAANPLFYNYTQQLSFNFISWDWLTFTAGGFILLYGFFYHRPIAELVLIDALASNQLYPHEQQTTTFLGKIWSSSQELYTGVILLALLNLLLLIVNALDLNFLYFGSALPANMTYSESVHQGIGMLIISILVAIAIILFYFRGNLNFYIPNKNLKFLTYAWILQNAFMLLSTAYRNYFYIQEYSLTYKRIGVFIYLLLVLLGLITTGIKIARIKSNWYLFRQNAWAAYLVLVLACFINWDLLITNFNINRAQKQQKSLDQEYLLSLSEVNLPALLQLQNQNNKSLNTSAVTILLPESELNLMKNSLDATLPYQVKLHAKLVDYLVTQEQKGWQSWNRTAQNVLSNIKALEQTRNIPRLVLPKQELDTLAFLAYFPHVTALNLPDNYLHDLSLLQKAPLLEQLDLHDNNVTSLSSLPALPHLKVLNMSENEFINAQPLKRLAALEQLHLSKNKLINLNTLPALPHLNYLDLSYTNAPNLTALKQFPKLHTLLLQSSLNQLEQPLPDLPTVQKLDISFNELGFQKSNFIQKLNGLQQVKHLNLSANKLHALTLAKETLLTTKQADSVKQVPGTSLLLPFTALESLNLANNYLKLIPELKAHTTLRELDLGGNTIQDLTPLTALPHLEKLYLPDNNLRHIDQLAAISTLKELNLAKNNITLNPQVFKQLHQLENLDVSENNLNQIRALSVCTALRSLNISYNHLTSLTVCQQFPRLEYLHIQGNSIQDYSPLYYLKNLKILTLDSTIPEAVYQSLRRALPQTKIQLAVAETPNS